MKKLGKKPARRSYTFKFTDIFDPSKLSVPAGPFGHHAAVMEWHWLGNDIAGCCVFSGAAHQEYNWSMIGRRPRVRITTKDVLSDYSAVTGYDGTDASDVGADMQDAAEYWRTTGIRDAVNIRHKIDAHVSLEVGNWDQMVLATFILGSSGIGLNLPKSAENQFDNGHQPWSVVQGSRISGGHYVPAVGRDANGNVLIVSWGALQPMTQPFYERYSDEARAYLSLEIIDDWGITPEGYDADALRKYIEGLGGQHA
jgi:hypothetical protein